MKSLEKHIFEGLNENVRKDKVLHIGTKTTEEWLRKNEYNIWNNTKVFTISFEKEGKVYIFDKLDANGRAPKNINSGVRVTNKLKLRSIYTTKGKKLKGLNAKLFESLRVGSKIRGTKGLTKGKEGIIKSIHKSGDGYDVDFGNGDIYGIMKSRIKNSEFKIVDEGILDVAIDKMDDDPLSKEKPTLQSRLF